MKEFDKIIGYDAIKNELIRLCDILVNPEKYKKFHKDCFYTESLVLEKL